MPSSILSYLRACVLACVTFAFEVLKRFTGSSGEPLQCGGMTGWGYEVGSVRGGLLSLFCHNWKRQWALTSVGGFWAELLSVGAPLWNKGKPKWTGWPIFHLFLPALLPSLPPSSFACSTTCIVNRNQDQSEAVCVRLRCEAECLRPEFIIKLTYISLSLSELILWIYQSPMPNHLSPLMQPFSFHLLNKTFYIF